MPAEGATNAMIEAPTKEPRDLHGPDGVRVEVVSRTFSSKRGDRGGVPRMERAELRPRISVRAIDPAAPDRARLRRSRGPVGVRDRIVCLADHGRAAPA